MHMMSEFRAHYVCANLNNVRENMAREVMKPGNPDLANLAFQWITIHYNGEKKATQQTTVIIEGRSGYVGNAHYSKIYKIQWMATQCRIPLVLNVTSTEADSPLQ